MNYLKMHTQNKIDANIAKIAALFPACVTEAKADDGSITRKIDFDVLRQELSSTIVEGREERYQFTWPDKRQAILTANAPINKTLRPCRKESVDFDNTENLYIEGDNLEALKLLQETYLGKIKMIYIDPPYNTGNDFVYSDQWTVDSDQWEEVSGQRAVDSETGEKVRLTDNYTRNTESNGRFHTDWLNMMYPRLKLARDLLSDDGVIFISIDDREVASVQWLVKEIFGECNFVAQFPWRKRTAKSDVPFGVSQDYEWIICCAKSDLFEASIEGGERKYYETPDFPNRPWRIHDMSTQRTATERPNSDFTIINPKSGEEFPVNKNAVWRITKNDFQKYYDEGRLVFPGDYDFLKISKPVLRYWKSDDEKKAGDNFGRIAVSTKLPDSIGMSQDGTKEITEILGTKAFPYPKSVELIKYLVKIATPSSEQRTVDSGQYTVNSDMSKNYPLTTDNCPLILDFFSGSATTAHAVMQLNAEDGGRRKFIMVQLPELCDEKSEAYKAGYKNICEIGKERIRRAGAQILKCHSERSEESIDVSALPQHDGELDIGFRVLKIDSSNMEDVYYSPERISSADLFKDNIKADRTGEDLLFQVMLDLGILLSSKIERKEVNGKAVYYVDGNYLVACFDGSVDEETITAIAKEKPYYFVMRDPSAAADGDSLITNFEQIFATYSPDTVRKIL